MSHFVLSHFYLFFASAHQLWSSKLHDHQSLNLLITIYILTRTKHNTTNLFLSPDHRTAFRSPATITLPLRPLLLLLLIHQPYIHNYRDFFSCYKCKLHSHSEQNRCAFIHKEISTQYNWIERIQCTFLFVIPYV